MLSGIAFYRPSTVLRQVVRLVVAKRNRKSMDFNRKSTDFDRKSADFIRKSINFEGTSIIFTGSFNVL